jgi:hypothetical protein
MGLYTLRPPGGGLDANESPHTIWSVSPFEASLYKRGELSRAEHKLWGECRLTCSFSRISSLASRLARAASTFALRSGANL